MKRLRMNNNGFTLIETTVAMLVMMIVGLSAASLFLYSVRYNSGASQRSIAMAVAQQRLEVLRGVDYANAGLEFGAHDPETVVIAATAPNTGYQTGANFDGGQSDAAPLAAAGKPSGDFSPYRQPTPTPTATPTPGGGGTTGGGSAPGSSTFQIQTEVVPFPIGAAEATATQKQITIRVVPVNGNRDTQWANLNPVEIVFHRSVGAPGPYKQ
jgi:type II secretory pathway pseudopilin PulG